MDVRGSQILGLFHAFIFNSKELRQINYMPWRLRRNFVKSYSPEEIVSWDSQIWLKRDDCAMTPTVVKDVPQLDAVPYNSPDIFYNPFTQYLLINKQDGQEAESVLKLLPVANRLALYSSGVILNCTANTLEQIYGKALHVIFLNMYTENVPTWFNQMAGEDLTLLNPTEAEVVAENPKFTNAPPTSFVQRQLDYGSGIPLADRPVVKLAPPVDINVVIDKKKVNIDFKNNNNVNVIAAVERRQTDANEEFTVLKSGLQIAANTKSSYIDQTAENGRVYIYKIRFAVMADSVGDDSSRELLPLKMPPAVIESLIEANYNPHENSITLTWKTPQNQYPVVYSVFKTAIKDGGNPVQKQVASGLREDKFFDSDIDKKADYIYRIITVDAADSKNESPLSADTERILVHGLKKKENQEMLSETGTNDVFRKKPFPWKNVAIITLSIMVVSFAGLLIYSHGVPAEGGKTATPNTPRHIVQATDSAGITGDSTVRVEGTLQLTARKTNGLWQSSDTKIAEVEKSIGLVTGKAKGNVIISYSLSNDNFKKAIRVIDETATVVSQEGDWIPSSAISQMKKLKKNKFRINVNSPFKISLNYKQGGNDRGGVLINVKEAQTTITSTAPYKLKGNTLVLTLVNEQKNVDIKGSPGVSVEGNGTVSLLFGKDNSEEIFNIDFASKETTVSTPNAKINNGRGAAQNAPKIVFKNKKYIIGDIIKLELKPPVEGGSWKLDNGDMQFAIMTDGDIQAYNKINRKQHYDFNEFGINKNKCLVKVRDIIGTGGQIYYRTADTSYVANIQLNSPN
ncbi:Ig-like domain-containing protein [Mucilaginibacter paludis]|nr:Ig-like domain-containing protein [Mucilaginibacter paludis]